MNSKRASTAKLRAAQYERKAWEYLATIPGEVGDAARREKEARSNREKRYTSR